MAGDSDKQIGTPESPRWEHVEPKEGTPHFYSNNLRIDWTAQDVRITFSEMHHLAQHELRQVDEKAMRVEDRVAVTMAWTRAKGLRDLMNGLIATYEKMNGEIKEPTLP